MDVNHVLQTFAIYALPVLFAITLHEAAHGYVARHFGDMTAHAQGRISLNPLRHIDLMGTIFVPIIILTATIAAGSYGVEPRTVIDLSGATPAVLRAGKGSLAPFEIEPV